MIAGKFVYPMIAERMVRQRITMMELAKRLGMSYSYLCRKLNGETKISLEMGFEIRRALGCEDMDLEKLFERVK